MAFATCPACGLKHTQRADGVCPRCGNWVNADAPAVAVPLPADAAAMGLCQACGASAPTCPVTFRQNIGIIVMRFQRKVSGQLCTDCVDRYFWKMTGTTFLVGWIGIVSLIVTPFFLIFNIRDFLSARRKFRLAGVGVDSRLALAALIVGLLSLIVCSPLVLPALIGIGLGLWALIRARRHPETYGGTVPALLGIAVSGASLMLMVLLTGLVLWSDSGRSDPAEAALRDADYKVSDAKDAQALGNTEDARTMSADVNEFCQNFGQFITKMQGKPLPSASTEPPCVTYVEARADKVCFLVRVPNLRQFSKETVESSAELFWQKARITAKKTYGRDDMKVAVGLRGRMLYGGLAIGVASGEKPTHTDTESAAYPSLLREFFAPLPSKAPAARPAASPR